MSMGILYRRTSAAQAVQSRVPCTFRARSEPGIQLIKFHDLFWKIPPGRAEWIRLKPFTAHWISQLLASMNERTDDD